MYRIFLASLSLSVIACQEQETSLNSNPRDVISMDQLITVSSDNEPVPNGQRLDLDMGVPFQDYLMDRLEVLEGEELNSQPQEVPVDADCIYGGELEGEIELILEPVTNWTLDLFDEYQILVGELDGVRQAMSNGYDGDPRHILTEDLLEITLHQEYVDVEIEANIEMVDGQGKLNGEWYICPQ